MSKKKKPRPYFVCRRCDRHVSKAENNKSYGMFNLKGTVLWIYGAIKGLCPVCAQELIDVLKPFIWEGCSNIHIVNVKDEAKTKLAQETETK